MFTFKQFVVAIVLLVIVGICALASFAWLTYWRPLASPMPKGQSLKFELPNLPVPSLPSNPPVLVTNPPVQPMPPSQLQVIGW